MVTNEPNCITTDSNKHTEAGGKEGVDPSNFGK